MMYIALLLLNKLLSSLNISQFIKEKILVIITFPLGTLISGTTFLLSAQYIVGLPANFLTLFITVVIPAILINTIGGFILYQVVNISFKRIIKI